MEIKFFLFADLFTAHATELLGSLSSRAEGNSNTFSQAVPVSTAVKSTAVFTSEHVTPVVPQLRVSSPHPAPPSSDSDSNASSNSGWESDSSAEGNAQDADMDELDADTPLGTFSTS